MPAPAAPADSLAVLLTSPIDARHAPLASNPAERFVFAHVYETLVRVDCLGRPAPGLARSWAATGGPARWTFILRDSVRFWNGDPLTAGDVIASWRDTGRDSSAALARRLARDATAIDDTTLALVLPDSQPLVLGDPELAVLRRGTRSGWAEGTGPYRARESVAPGARAPASPPLLLLLEPMDADRPRLTIHAAAGDSDARDLIDAGVDLLLTENSALADYASVRPDFTSIPLTWDRTWALLVPRRTRTAPDSTMRADSMTARTLALRSALATGVVRADARAAQPSHWWDGASACATPSGSNPSPGHSPPARIVYRRGDSVGRSLAERLVALAAMGARAEAGSALAVLAPDLVAAGERATAVGMAPDDAAAALRAGTALGFVVSLPRRSLAPCDDVARLVALAPWLAPDPTRSGISGVVVPLIDTRLRAVVRRDRTALGLAWDSTVTIGHLFRGSHGGAR